jgi:uncharacterized protein (DUF433 family)
MSRSSRTIDIGSLVTHSPSKHKNQAKIAGTDVAVSQIVLWYKLGMTPEEISLQYEGRIHVAQIYAALAYYHVNREEIEADLVGNRQTSEEIAKRLLSKIQGPELSEDFPLDSAIEVKIEGGMPIMRASAPIQRRIEQLLEKRSEAELSEAEMNELAQYAELDDYFSLINRLVRNSLLTEEILAGAVISATS